MKFVHTGDGSDLTAERMRIILRESFGSPGSRATVTTGRLHLQQKLRFPLM